MDTLHYDEEDFNRASKIQSDAMNKIQQTRAIINDAREGKTILIGNPDNGGLSALADRLASLHCSNEVEDLPRVSCEEVIDKTIRPSMRQTKMLAQEMMNLSLTGRAARRDRRKRERRGRA